MTRREWWIWRGHTAEKRQIYAVLIDPITDRIVSAWGPVDHRPRGTPSWDSFRVQLPRRYDAHGRRLPGSGPAAPLDSLLSTNPAILSALEERRGEIQRLQAG